MNNFAFSICMPAKEWGVGLLRESDKSRLTTSWFDILPVNDLTRSCKSAGVDGAAVSSSGCCPVEEEVRGA